jgi:hypothetical protein
MKPFSLGMTLAIGVLVTLPIGILVHSDPAIADQRPDLATIFSGNYQQIIDPSGTVSRAAFDGCGRLIGVQVGTYSPGEPNGMQIEKTYLEPDAKHPLGQAFDGAGNPLPLY